MNKKLFSAVLMGALLLGGTFVSCQDYDDDIENLQNQIDKLASSSELSAQVSSLQSQISAAQAAAEAKAAAASTVAEAAKKAAEAAATPADVAKAAQDAADKVAADLASAKSDLEAKAAAAQAAADEATAALAAVKNDMNATNGDVAKAQKAADDAAAAAQELAAKLAEVEAAAKGAQAAADAAAAKAEAAATPEQVAAAVKEAADALQAKIEANATEIATLKADLAKIQEALSQPVDDTALAALQAQVKELAEAVAVLSGAKAAELVSVSAPYHQVEVNFEWAKFEKPKKDKDLTLFNAIVAKYPVVGEIENKSLRNQGGHLPVLVTPANVTLTNDFVYELQSISGDVADIKFGTPVEGMVGAYWKNDSLRTRALSGSACLWTLPIEPQIVNGGYATVEENYSALAVATEKGTELKTAFAYKVISNNLTNKDVEIKDGKSAYYSEKINLLAQDAKTDEIPVELKNNYIGYQIITATSKYQREKYGIEIIDDQYLVMNMPASENEVKVALEVTALGLNGSVLQKKDTVTIYQNIANTSNLLTEVTKILNGHEQQVTWSIDLLSNSAVVLDQILNGNPQFIVTLNDEDGKPISGKKIYNNNVIFWKDAYTQTTYNSTTHEWSNGEPTMFGFTINAVAATLPTGADVLVQAPAEYTVELVAKSNNTTVIYQDATTLTTNLPALDDTFIKIATGFNDNGVLRVIGSANGDSIKYGLENGFVLKNVQISSFVDADYDENNSNIYDYAHYNWVKKGATGNTDTLAVHTWSDAYGVNAASLQQLNYVRNMVAKVYLFNNPLNAAEYEFQAKVVSPIYQADGKVLQESSAFTTKYGGDAIKIKDKIKHAKYVAGPETGQYYNLWNTTAASSGSAAIPAHLDTVKAPDFDQPKNIDNKILNTSNNVITITDATFLNIWWPSELSTGHILKTDEWRACMTTVKKYYHYDAATQALAQTEIWQRYDVSNDELSAGFTYYEVVYDNIKGKKINLTTGVLEVGDATGDTLYIANGIPATGANKVYTAANWRALKLDQKETGKAYYWKKTVKETCETTSIAPNATEELQLTFYKTYVTNINFNQKVDLVKLVPEVAAVDPSAASGLGKYLASEPTLYYGDEEEDKKYFVINGTTITPKSTALAEAPESITRTVYLIVKDKWGRTMYCPITVTVKTN